MEEQNNPVTEEGIDFSKLNFPFKPSHAPATKRRYSNRRIYMNEEGKYVRLCTICLKEFMISGAYSKVYKCPDCSLIKLNCKICNAEFFTSKKNEKVCENCRANRLARLKKTSISYYSRSLLSSFTKECNFYNQREAINFVIRFYYKHREEAEKEREIFRINEKQKVEAQKLECENQKQLLKRQIKNPDLDLSGVSSLN